MWSIKLISNWLVCFGIVVIQLFAFCCIPKITIGICSASIAKCMGIHMNVLCNASEGIENEIPFMCQNIYHSIMAFYKSSAGNYPRFILQISLEIIWFLKNRKYTIIRI